MVLWTRGLSSGVTFLCGSYIIYGTVERHAVSHQNMNSTTGSVYTEDIFAFEVQSKSVKSTVYSA